MHDSKKLDLVEGPKAASPAAAQMPGVPSGDIVAGWWRRLMKHVVPYQPERHYMRGPGPKWREKHGTRKCTDR